jgi:hypothetical protein
MAGGASTVSIEQRIAPLHLPADARRSGGRERGRERGRGRGRRTDRGTEGEPHRIVGLLDVVQLPLLAFHLADLELQKLDAEGVCTEGAEVTCTPRRRAGGAQPHTRGSEPNTRPTALRRQPSTALPSSSTTPTPTRRAFCGPRFDTKSRRLTAP